MDRRTFLRAGGSSLAGLLMIREGMRVATAGEAHRLIPPARVFVSSGGRRIVLTTSNGSTWSALSIQVTLTETEEDLAVELESPSRGVSSVELVWSTPNTGGRKVLGDQWERGYGNLAWRNPDPQAVMPWYFLEFDGTTTNCIGVKTGCRAMCFWQLRDNELALVCDTRSGGDDVLPGARRLRLAEIVVHRSVNGENPYETARAFCGRMCRDPRLPSSPVYGINDWYYTYGRNSARTILENCFAMSELAPSGENRPFAVVDAGWAVRASKPSDPTWGDDFTSPNEQFGDMADLAEKINAAGMRPGIWTRPLCARPKDRNTLCIPGTRCLDPTIPENLERVKDLFLTYRRWGYHLVKFDFTAFDVLGKWGFQMGGDVVAADRLFNDHSLTNAEIFLTLYRAIRSSAGEMILLACNTPSHLSAGLFELCRIGDDTSGIEWERTRTMGVNSLAFRICQDRTFYSADGDCVGLTAKVPWEKNRQWMHLLAESGTPLFISADPEMLGEEQKTTIRRSFDAASRVIPPGEPLDWLTRPLPERWKLDGQTVEFSW